MAFRPTLSPAHAGPCFPALLARIMLAYVLVFQGIAGAAASGLFIPVGTDGRAVICHGAAEGSSDEEQPPHDMACCLTGCLAGGALLPPPERPAPVPPGWHPAQRRLAVASIPALPRAPTAAFHARGPPVAS